MAAAAGASAGGVQVGANAGRAALLGAAGNGGGGDSFLEKNVLFLKEIKSFLNDIANILKKMSSPWREIENAAFKAGRTMAMTRFELQQYNKVLRTATRAMGAMYNVTAEEIAKFQEQYSEATGRNIKLTEVQLSHMAALSKIIDPSTAALLTEEFEKIGAGIGHTVANTELIQERAKSLGLNATKATKGLADNIKLASKFSFRGGVEEIQQMVLKSQALKMNMSAVMNAAEKFMDIEGAISTSANIQVLGGTFANAFSNPMQAMYEAEANPQAFQERLISAIEGKGAYDKKSGTVTFDPVTMRIIREAAKQLGMSVEELTQPAAVSTQNEVIEQELNRNAAYSQFDERQKTAIYNLSRGNIDEETGEHFINYIWNGEVQTAKVSELTEEQLEVATKSQLTQEQLWTDVHVIKDLLQQAHGRAIDTKTLDESINGIKQTGKGIIAGLTNIFMQPFSDLALGFGKIFSNFTGMFASGGVVPDKPITRAATGTIIPGDSYTGDKVPVLANSGEMILNKGQQSTLFTLLGGSAVAGAGMWGANKLGNKMGMGGLGKSFLLSNLLTGGQSGVGDVLMTHMMMKGAGSMFRGEGFFKGVKKELKSLGGATRKVFGGLTKSAEGAATTAENAAKATQNASKNLLLTGKEQSGPTKLITDVYKNGNIKSDRQSVQLVDSKGQPISMQKETPKKPGVIERAKTATKGAVAKVSAKIPQGVKTTMGKVGSGAGKFFSKVGGKFLGPLATVMAVGSAIGGVSSANSQFDEKVKQIESSGMSDEAKARATVEARKERNQNRGKSIGGGVGTIAGAALGSLLGPIGTIAGGAIGSWLGSGLGGVIGGLFGGGKKLKPKKQKGQEQSFDSASTENGNAVAANENPESVTGGGTSETSAASSSSNEGVISQLKAINAKIPTAQSIARNASSSSTGGSAGGFANTLLKASIFGPVGEAIGSLFGKRPSSEGEGSGFFGSIGSFFGNLFGIRKLGLKPDDVKDAKIDEKASKDKFYDENIGKEIRVNSKSVSIFGSPENTSPEIVRAKEENNFSRVAPVELKSQMSQTQNVSLDGANINLNINGTIRLEANGLTSNLNMDQLMNNDTFKSAITDMVIKEWNGKSNAGRSNNESLQNNMASNFYKTGA